jgi:ribonuclease D
MTDAITRPPIWVDQPGKLNEMMQDIKQQPAVGLDTESNSLFAYQERVCLIQLSTPNQDYLVDTLALPDLSSLGELFASQQIQKVFHAAEYDLICLKRDYSFTFTNIFDTMIAARTLGYKQIGLAAMLQQVLGIDLDKRYQRANWGQRPLKPEMLEYARRDSHYMISLRDHLLTQLNDRHRLSMLQEDCDRLCRTAQPMPNHKVDIWKVKGATDLKPRQLTNLQSLLELREKIARSEDKPPFKILSEQALLEVAQTQPRYLEELNLLPSMSRGQVQRFGKGLLMAVNNAKHAPIVPRNLRQKPDQKLLARKDILGDWRKQTGERLGVPSDVILPREMLLQIAEENPRSLDDLEKIMSGTPFRFEAYGKEIISKLEGK